MGWDIWEMNGKGSVYYLIFLWQMIYVRKSYAQIFKNSVFKVVNKTVDSQFLSVFPGLLNTRDSGDVVNLMLYIKLAEFIPVLFLAVNKLFSVNGSHLSNMGKPAFERAVVVFPKSCFDSSASIMPCYNDVLYFEDFYCVLYDCQAINVRRWSLVGNVPMNKDLAWL